MYDTFLVSSTIAKWILLFLVNKHEAQYLKIQNAFQWTGIWPTTKLSDDTLLP